MTYGCYNFFSVRRFCVRFLCWAACCTLSQVVHAEFTSSDSYTLEHIYRVVNTINTGYDSYSVNGEGYTLFDVDSNILESLRDYIYPVVSSIDTTSSEILGYIKSSVDTEQRSLSKLASIDSSLSNISSYLTNNLVIAISNVYASIPQCYAIATNQFSFDTTVLTNILYASQVLFDSISWFGDTYWSPKDIVSYYWYGDSDSADSSELANFWASSRFGFLTALWQDACVPSGWYFGSRPPFENPLYAAYDYWISDNSGNMNGLGVDLNYSIFEAYNTLGISNGISKVYSLLSDDDNGISSISSSISSLSVTNNNYYTQVLSNLFNIVVAAEVIISNQSSSESSSVLAEYETNSYVVTDFFTPVDDFWTDVNSDVTTDTGAFYSLFNAATDATGNLHFNDLVNSQERHNYQVSVGGFRLSDLNGGISVPTIRYEIALADLLDTDLSDVLPAIHAFFALFCFFLGVMFFVGQVRSLYTFFLNGFESANLHSDF